MWKINWVAHSTPCDRIQIGNRMLHMNANDIHTISGKTWVDKYMREYLTCGRVEKMVITAHDGFNNIKYHPSAFISCRGCRYRVED